MHAFSPSIAWSLLVLLAAPAIPVAYLVAAWLPFGARPPRRLSVVPALALGLSLLVSAGLGWVVPAAAPLVARLPHSIGLLSPSLRLDAVTCLMLVLVHFIALVIGRFSQRYLEGESGQGRFTRAFMTTLAAVSALILANNLLLIALAWIGTSLSLHQLLTFYPARPQALVAAHKKFLVSRVADLCLLGAITLIGRELSTLELDGIQASVLATGALSTLLELAAVLLVLGTALKCAQLPFHGWLIQVMEAPTPVSALLHAGVVNIGGFLMIRLSSFMAQAEAAQTLLVLIGSTTAVIAALVMMTQNSVKVMLAWSTCAQMGFMLLQCGLGAYRLALLHLVAHSLYKAHAFLSAGSAVDVQRAHALRPPLRAPSMGAWLFAMPPAALVVILVASGFGAKPVQEPSLWAFATIVSFALAPLAVYGPLGSARGLTPVPPFLGTETAAFPPFRGFRPRSDLRSNLRARSRTDEKSTVPALQKGRNGSLSQMAVGGAVLALLYFGWHALMGRLVPEPAAASGLGLRIAIVLVSFSCLFGAQVLLSAAPEGRLARMLCPRLHLGLHLDELFTRLTFRFWPPKLPPRPAARAHGLSTITASEA